MVPALEVSKKTQATLGALIGLTCQYEKEETQQCTITHIQDPTCEISEAQVSNPVEHCIRKYISSAGASSPERPPLPVVVLAAEQKVYEQYSHGGAGDNHDTVAKEEEAEHIVNSAGPDATHDEVKLDNDSTEGQDADEKHGRDWAEVGCARRNLARYLIGAYRRFNTLDDVCCISMTYDMEGLELFPTYRLPKADPATSTAQGYTDYEPNADDDNHSSEGNGTT